MSVMDNLIKYRSLFLLALIMLLFFIFLLILSETVKKIKEILDEKKNKITREDILKSDIKKVKESKKSFILRNIIAPDAINPGPDDHLIIYDGIKKVYARSLTISKLPKTVVFATTFADLFNFPDSTNTVFVDYIPESEMSKKLDKHVMLLEAEYIASGGDTNRQRKLNSQFLETSTWASEIESGKNKFYRVGFVFTLFAPSLEELTKRSDRFRNLARNRGVEVTATVFLQSEAYLSNAPFNRYVSNNTSMVNANDGIFYHYMDKYAASTIFNYTSLSYSHKDGIPLGRDRNTQKPVIYNPYHPSFNGYTFCVVGKTGVGKSAMIKMMTYRLSVMNYRFASLDVQPRQGTGDGEYAGICHILGGLNFELKSDSENCLNIFEVMPTTRFEKTGLSSGKEIPTLELNLAIAQAANLIMIMIAENGSADSMKDNVILNNIIKDTIERMYAYFSIKDADPESLYEYVNNEKKEKRLPTISDFFKILLKDQKKETDEDKLKIRKIIILAMEDYVKDLYYSEKSLTFFTKEEYESLKGKDNTLIKVYRNKDGEEEIVRHLHGTRGYFDGQSTLRYKKSIPWVNIDCSQMDEISKVVAMSVGMNYINERIIKGNSSSRDHFNRVMVVFDEAHMVFKISPARKLLDEIVRTARKRNVSLAICTQTLKEFSQYPETEGIRKNAAALFIFKQDYGDKEYLLNTLGITLSQVEDILEQGGNLDKAASGDYEEEVELEKMRHRGETTLIINKTVIPLKIDYRKKTEKYAVETSAEELIEKISYA